MALFQTVQRIYKTMAIHPSLSQSNQFCSLNVKIQFYLIITSQTLFGSTAFLFCKANTIQSMADSFYVSLTHAVCLIYILITMWKVADILQLIDKCEKFIEKSELKQIFVFNIENCSFQPFIYSILVQDHWIQHQMPQRMLN